MALRFPKNDSFDKYKESEVKKMDRCELLFLESCKSEYTKKLYKFALKDFMSYGNLKRCQDILLLDRDDLQILLEDYTLNLKRTKQPKTSKCYLGGVKHFMDMNDIMLNFKKAKKLLPDNLKPAGRKAYTNDDIKEMISYSSSKKFVAIVHILASSGMRIGSIPDIQFKHLEDMAHGCKSVLVYPNTKDEYTTFISQEAVHALEIYIEERKSKGETITSESFVIVKNCYRGFEQLNYAGLIHFMLLHIRKLKSRIKSDTQARFDKQTNHAFRKRFDTIMKTGENVNISLVERMMGHSTTVKLDNSYFDPSVEQLFKEYLKGLPRLFVDEKYRLESELLVKQQKIEELESDKNQIKLLNEKMALMQAHIDNIQIKS